MALVIQNVGAPIDETTVRQFEQTVGADIPTDYRDFLLKNNGGKPTPNVFDIPQENNASVLREFFGLNGAKTSKFQAKLETYKDRYPADMLPIGSDPSGNLVLLSVTGTEKGKVYFWDHELEADDERQPYYENIYLISNSFAEFLEGLHEDPDE